MRFFIFLFSCFVRFELSVCEVGGVCVWKCGGGGEGLGGASGSLCLFVPVCV